MERPIDRLIAYIEDKGISPSQAEKTLGTANAYIQNAKNRKGEIGSSILNKIATEFLDLNLIWLITGKGEMLLPTGNDNNNSTSTHNATDKINIVSDKESDNILHPTKGKKLHPKLHPASNLGLPKVVTVTESNDDIISLVGVKVAAGYLNGYGDPEYIETLPTLRVPGVKGGTHRAFEVKGHSMSPTLYNSSIVVGRWIEDFSEIRDRRIYIIVTKSEGIVVKRVLNRVSESDKLILISDNHNKREYPNILLSPDDVLEIWYVRGAFSFEFPEPDALNQRVNDLEARLTFLNDKIDRMGV